MKDIERATDKIRTIASRCTTKEGAYFVAMVDQNGDSRTLINGDERLLAQIIGAGIGNIMFETKNDDFLSIVETKARKTYAKRIVDKMEAGFDKTEGKT